MESTHTVSAQQAKALHARVASLNAAQHAAASYFAPICDGLGLPETTEFVSIDAETGTLVVKVPDDG